MATLLLDARVMARTMAAALLAAPVFGLFPALLASKPDVVPLLKGSAPAAGGRRWRVTPRNLLVVGQIAVSLALLVSSALLARSFANQRQIDPGFVPRPRVFSTMAPGEVGYDGARTRDFYARLLDRLAATPGVERATMAGHLPLNSLFGGGARAEVVIPGSVYGLSRFDPLTYAATSALVLLTAVAGSYVPARRASRVDPIAALRSE